ncbi:MAG TPA: hypothetical protein ENJ82_11820 [Bacteroidetes bacterium]|nr:hypothetical protein [Bacteroidota bacterium]
MKKIILLPVLLAILSSLAFSCEQNISPEPDALQVSDKTIAYETVVRVPLSSKHFASSGELEILDLSLVNKENIAVLKPTISQVWADVKAGKVASFYPEEIDEPAEQITDDNYFNHISSRFKENGHPVNEAHLLASVEVILEGLSGEGNPGPQASALRFVWMDELGKTPDFNFCLIPGSELKTYSVKTVKGHQPLLAYLSARTYAGYNISVTTRQGIARCRNLKEALKMEVLIAQGEFEQLEFH